MTRSPYSLTQHSPASLQALQALKTHEAGDPSETEQKELGGTTSLLFVFALVLVFPILLIIRMDPQVDRWIANDGKPTLVVGTVQSIQYVGHLGHFDTQINTDQQTLLVEGSAAVSKGTPLEWRRNKLYGDLCVVGTDRCWNLLQTDREDEQSTSARPVSASP
jgi:hypothetical protein